MRLLRNKLDENCYSGVLSESHGQVVMLQHFRLLQ